jgi:type IV secretory pathway protease TraF
MCEKIDHRFALAHFLVKVKSNPSNGRPTGQYPVNPIKNPSKIGKLSFVLKIFVFIISGA